MTEVYCVFCAQGPGMVECLESVWSDLDAAEREATRLNAEGRFYYFVAAWPVQS